jgi:hypothetical protein
MTYHHFINVAALAFAPYWIFYRARIAAQSESKSILLGAGFYLIAQFLELITLATFVSGGSPGLSAAEATGSLLHILQVRSFVATRLLRRDGPTVTTNLFVAVTAYWSDPSRWNDISSCNEQHPSSHSSNLSLLPHFLFFLCNSSI